MEAEAALNGSLEKQAHRNSLLPPATASLANFNLAQLEMRRQNFGQAVLHFQAELSLADQQKPKQNFSALTFGLSQALGKLEPQDGKAS